MDGERFSGMLLSECPTLFSPKGVAECLRQQRRLFYLPGVMVFQELLGTHRQPQTQFIEFAVPSCLVIPGDSLDFSQACI